MMSFNIFQILSKDDKELIHSSFLGFMIREDVDFARDFFGIELADGFEMRLEKSYTYGSTKKKKKCRLDLEILQAGQIAVVENKFKSFPSTAQLAEYDTVLNEKFKGFKHQKFVLCFDSELIPEENGWKVKDYGELLTYLAGYVNKVRHPEKKMFIQHYCSFLKEYVDKYALYKVSARALFMNRNDNMNKFWIRLLYSNVRNALSRHFSNQGVLTEIYLAPGNTNLPLLNITPAHWKLNGFELLIQVQNGDFKFYAHTDNKDFLRKMVAFSKEHLESKHVTFKNVGNKVEQTSYIFKINIKLASQEEINVASLTDWIIKFYDSVDHTIIQNYKNGVQSALLAV